MLEYIPGSMIFTYGVMGSGKSAEALILKNGLENCNKKVWLIKPAVDTRDGMNIVKSRNGLQSEAEVFASNDSIRARWKDVKPDIIIADESQFFTADQIDELREICSENNIFVACFGLRTDFTTHMFEGSARLLETADTIKEIIKPCRCGRKATINARIANGKIVTVGQQIMLGGDESYEAICAVCYRKEKIWAGFKPTCKIRKIG